MATSATGTEPPPTVSVITIFRDAERFLPEAVESVLAQTYTDWELLLVDDGSTDSSTDSALCYAASHPGRIRYIGDRPPLSRGTGPARNIGLRSARGRYIAFLDADDVWLPHALALMVAHLEAHPERGMVYGATEYWYRWPGNAARSQRPDVVDFKSGRGVPPGTLVRPPELLTYFLRDSGAVPCMCSLLVRRDVVERVGGFEDAFRGLYEDQVFYVKVSLEAPVYVIDGHWARYRQHDESTCALARRTGEERRARLRFLTWLARYVEEKGVTDVDVQKALRDQMWPYVHPVLARLEAWVRPLARRIKRPLRDIAHRVLRPSVRATLRGLVREHRYTPPVGWVRLGDLRRVTPISADFGYDRGLPVDRHYIEAFLGENAADIRGRVLEVGDAAYTRLFGAGRVTVSNVLHVAEGNPDATYVADLAAADNLPTDAFDCIILTQTLHLIYDVPAAIRTLRRILKPGGVVLATVPGISQISTDEWGECWYWSFTALSVRRLVAEHFGADGLQVESHGNVLAATAFLQGLASRELRPEELRYRDPQYQLVITIRAVAPTAS